MGNIHSLVSKFKRLGLVTNIISEPNEILHSQRLILPGVGHFGKGMENINRLMIKDSILEFVTIKQRPVLGICLGMQLLTDHSEEGNSEGLGIIPGETVRFQIDDPKLKIPHMGWNTIQLNQSHDLFRGIDEHEMFYFVHAFHVMCRNDGHNLAKTTYGCDFTSVIVRDNVFGVQFHPEKSHDWGLQVLKNFCEL